MPLDPPALRVLLVDDEQPIRLICRVNLEADGMTVEEAADGETALARIRCSRPDAVVLDVMMPGLSGWEVALSLRTSEETSALPLIFLTAVADADAEERALCLGATYVAKPFDLLQLPRIVRGAVAAG